MAETILVVDDNESAARIAATFLSANGYTVAVASDGARALELVARQPPDCIVLDVMMPRMSGIEVLNRLKQDPATASIPVILATAKTQDEDLLAGYNQGADYYITKPFSQHELVYGIRLVLGQQPAPSSVGRPE